MTIRLALAAATALLMGTPLAQAGEVYTGVGIPGVMVGYAHALSPTLTVRGDFATLGSHDDRRSEGGIDYDTQAAFSRTGLFADWFVAGGFRLTGGVTFNRLKADLHARGDGRAFQIGDVTVIATPDDRLDVKIEYPKVTPYLGFGYGHQASSGWGFIFDIGASIGKAKVSETHSGPTFSTVAQAEIDKEMAEVRDGVAKFRAIPQLTVGVNYRF
ncbi:MAG: hypothetical protein ACM32J_04465 [Rhizobacter sp.]|jgi:hypothetical protein